MIVKCLQVQKRRKGLNLWQHYVWEVCKHAGFDSSETESFAMVKLAVRSPQGQIIETGVIQRCSAAAWSTPC